MITALWERDRPHGGCARCARDLPHRGRRFAAAAQTAAGAAGAVAISAKTKAARWHAHDRSSIYGGFHVYTRRPLSVSARRHDDHAALMDEVYRHQRYIYDFTRKYYLFGRDRLIRELDLQARRAAGRRSAAARRAISSRSRGAIPSARLYGLDASQEMLQNAPNRPSRAPGFEAASRSSHGLCRRPDARAVRRDAAVRPRRLFLQSVDDSRLATGA